MTPVQRLIAFEPLWARPPCVQKILQHLQTLPKKGVRKMGLHDYTGGSKEEGFLKAGMLLALAGVLVLAFGAVGSTGPDNQNLKVVLHVVAHDARSCSENMPAITDRSDLVRMWDTYTDVDVFFVVFSYDSLTIVQFELEWPVEWGSGVTNHCSDLAIGSIENSGDQLSLAWQTCQSSDVRPQYWPVAWTWLMPTSDGEIGIGSHYLSVVDCGFQEAEPESIFNAGLNTDPYEGPPAGGVATVASTWGAVKAMFR